MTVEIKRYSLSGTEEPQGDYVRWEDHERKVEELEEFIQELQEQTGREFD